METNYKEISKLKTDLSEALILRIEKSDNISSFSLEKLSADINTDLDVVCSVVNDIIELPLYILTALLILIGFILGYIFSYFRKLFK